MPIEIPALNFLPLMPYLIITAAALLVMALDLAFVDKRIAGYAALLGPVGVAVSSYWLWYHPIPDVNFQTMFRSDGFTLYFCFLFAINTAFAIMLAVDYLKTIDVQRGEYYALILFSCSGMILMAGATDLLVIFLGLEVMSVSLYILAGIDRRRSTSIEAALKYFILGAFASAFFLYGICLIFGATGSTNIVKISAWLGTNKLAFDPISLVGLALLLVGFAFKIALVPFQWWTPDVYQGAPTSVTAFMSVGVKAAGFAALTRLLWFSFAPTFMGDWSLALAILAVLTMTVGNIVALAQKNVKRMLAYSSIAHAGYALVGVAAANSDGLVGVLFYLMGYAFMNMGAFAVVIAMEKKGTTGPEITDYAGLSRRDPLMAFCLAVFMLSLIGMPPFVGFWGKLFVFRSAIQSGMTWLAVVGVINSAISAYYYLSLLIQAYFRPPATEEPSPELPATSGIVLVAAATLTVMLGVLPLGLLNIVNRVFYG
jgi:NADH-quinone oxidoreductase subunit N